MSEDRSLDEFDDAGEGSDDEPADDGSDDTDDEPRDTDVIDENETDDGVDDRVTDDGVDDDSEPDDHTEIRDPDAVESATATYDWSPDGAECEECGTTVDRRWIDGDTYVCGNCKEW